MNPAPKSSMTRRPMLRSSSMTLRDFLEVRDDARFSEFENEDVGREAVLGQKATDEVGKASVEKIGGRDVEAETAHVVATRVAPGRALGQGLAIRN